MVLKLGPIIIGIALIILIKFITSYEIIGLIGVGFLVGYMTGGGAMTGLINSVIVGTMGSIFETIILIFMNSSVNPYSFIINELTSLTLMVALTTLVYSLMYFCIVMGIAGAIGGALNNSFSRYFQ